MFGLDFLFSAGLLALPIAGLPLVLHLLFRRKSPVVQFSTLRFIKSSVQQTAARKKVQRWLLLACRALLLALLVWAIAQPALRPAVGADSGAKSIAAVVVVDTSYSMELQDGSATLLARADAAVRELLNGQLRGAKVAVLRSAPAPADRPELEELRRQETLRDASQIKWAPLTPQGAGRPLVDRVAEAVGLLDRQPAEQKWLVVISDFQKKEFPRQLSAPKEGRVILIDLHPAEVRSGGVSGIRMQPEQPTPGIQSGALVEITGRPNDVRQVNLSMTAAGPEAGNPFNWPPQPANLDANGRAKLRFGVEVPPRGYLKVEASLAQSEPLAWARTRSLLLQVPPRQVVTLLDAPGFESARKRLAWALDPSDGQSSAWALSVRQANDLSADTNVAVQIVTDWPDIVRAQKLQQFVRAGGTLIWFIRPGLEQTWESLPPAQQREISYLLPGRPAPEARTADANTVAATAPNDPALLGLTDPRFQLGGMTVSRYVPFEAIAGDVTTLLTVNPGRPAPGLRPHGLLFRRPVGSGMVFMFTTLADKRYSIAHLNATFPPMLVQMSLRPPGRSDAFNVDAGQTLVLAGRQFDGYPELRVQGPGGDLSIVKPTPDERLGRRFVYDWADALGLYTWKKTSDDSIVAMSLVQPPADEADVRYAAAESVAPPGSDVVVARSVEELGQKFSAMSQPEPKWAMPIAIVMLLMCAEAIMGSARTLWTPGRLTAFLPRFARSAV